MAVVRRSGNGGTKSKSDEESYVSRKTGEVPHGPEGGGTDTYFEGYAGNQALETAAALNAANITSVLVRVLMSAVHNLSHRLRGSSKREVSEAKVYGLHLGPDPLLLR
jgi:hypothetical protein